MAFSVVIATNKVDQKETLVEACQMFIQKVNELFEGGSASAFIVFETCWVETEINGRNCIMNFDAIREFAHAVGILERNGKPKIGQIPHIPNILEQQIVLVAFANSMEAFIDEHLEMLTSLSQNAPGR